jgi:predicted nucleotidyltransferase component of viral defense system
VDLDDIKRFSGEKRVPVGIIEKDYVLSLVLVLLSKGELQDHLVFKGGTAIKKMYFPDARFSVDLDFDFVGISIGRIKQELTSLIAMDLFDTVHFVKCKQEFESKKSDVYRCMIEYTGPLKHNVNQSVRLDFNKGESSGGTVQRRSILDEYGDETMDSTIPTMDISEMFAEKCRALLTRKEQQSKDLFDIYFLIGKNVVMDRVVIRQKFLGYKEQFALGEFTRVVRQISPVWKRDLQDLLPRGSVPEITDVVSVVRTRLFKNV